MQYSIVANANAEGCLVCVLQIYNKRVEVQLKVLLVMMYFCDDSFIRLKLNILTSSTETSFPLW